MLKNSARGLPLEVEPVSWASYLSTGLEAVWVAIFPERRSLLGIEAFALFPHALTIGRCGITHGKWLARLEWPRPSRDLELQVPKLDDQSREILVSKFAAAFQDHNANFSEAEYTLSTFPYKKGRSTQTPKIWFTRFLTSPPISASECSSVGRPQGCIRTPGYTFTDHDFSEAEFLWLDMPESYANAVQLTWRKSLKNPLSDDEISKRPLLSETDGDEVLKIEESEKLTFYVKALIAWDHFFKYTGKAGMPTSHEPGWYLTIKGEVEVVDRLVAESGEPNWKMFKSMARKRGVF